MTLHPYMKAESRPPLENDGAQATFDCEPEGVKYDLINLIMQVISALTCVCFVCGLTGCGTLKFLSDGGSNTGQPGPMEVYTNGMSQFYFPPQVGSFNRVNVSVYDRRGEDVGVGYNDSLVEIAMTVYVYPIASQPPNDTLMGHYGTCKAEVLKHHDGAQLVSGNAVQISPGGVQQNGQHAVFTYTDDFDNRMQPLRSELYLFTHGSRFVMYRVSYPLGHQEMAEPAIKNFMDQLVWP